MQNLKKNKELVKEVSKGEYEALRKAYDKIVDKASYEQLRILFVMARNIVKERA